MSAFTARSSRSRLILAGLFPFSLALCLHIPNHRLRSRSPSDSPSLLVVSRLLSALSAAPMSDDARSVNTKKVGRRQWHRVLVVSNRSSSDDDVGHPVPEPKSLYQNYPPRPLPVPSRPTPSIEPFPDARHQSGPNSNAMRPPVTTDNINQPPRSVHSNPSSPSSASSPAVDSTPPPSTPGLSTIQVNEEGTGTFRQEMFTSMVAKDRHENTAQISRLRQYVRSQAPVPSHERRYSNGGSRPATVRPSLMASTTPTDWQRSPRLFLRPTRTCQRRPMSIAQIRWRRSLCSSRRMPRTSILLISQAL